MGHLMEGLECVLEVVGPTFRPSARCLRRGRCQAAGPRSGWSDPSAITSRALRHVGTLQQAANRDAAKDADKEHDDRPGAVGGWASCSEVASGEVARDAPEARIGAAILSKVAADHGDAGALRPGHEHGGERGVLATARADRAARGLRRARGDRRDTTETTRAVESLELLPGPPGVLATAVLHRATVAFRGAHSVHDLEANIDTVPPLCTKGVGRKPHTSHRIAGWFREFPELHDRVLSVARAQAPILT
mmetsp:Transcript_56370/g.157061  ORF Transcript_56370/g.157061 Transcript_56370/m.157061 type:complete len:249 (+) Transcript_56370:4051-4797(+)